MEHFIRIAFWIVTLSACCQAKSLPKGYSSIEFLRTRVQCPTDSTFYAPTNVEPKCITTALDCFKKEIDVTVTSECHHPTQFIEQAIDFLDKKITESAKDYALTNSTECACEAHPQLPFSEFLDEMASLLQHQYTLKSLGR